MSSCSLFSAAKAWATPYANDKLANIVIKGLTTVTGMTDPEKAAVKGFAETVKAIDLICSHLRGEFSIEAAWLGDPTKEVVLGEKMEGAR